MNSNYYNQTQKQIVELCEKANYYGIRHKGLSGTVCEDVLTNALKRDVADFKFGRGVIKFSKNLGADIKTKNDLSPQIDILIYKGEPIINIHNTVVVDISQVAGIIEVKKWLFPKNMSRAQETIGKLKLLIEELKNKTSKEVKIFLVAIRFHDRFTIDVNFFSELKKYPASNTYCFYSHYSKDVNGKILFPWEDKDWDNFNESMYAKQYEKLVNDIRLI